MQAAQDMGRRLWGQRSRRAGVRSMGNRLRGRFGKVWGGALQRAASLGLEVIHRDRVCLALAIAFTGFSWCPAS